jgi:hypothetical protein
MTIKKIHDLIFCNLLLAILLFSQCKNNAKPITNIKVHFDTIYQVNSSRYAEFMPMIVFKLTLENLGTDTAIFFPRRTHYEMLTKGFFSIFPLDNHTGLKFRMKHFVGPPGDTSFNYTSVSRPREDQLVLLPGEKNQLEIYRYYYYTGKKEDSLAITNFFKKCEIKYVNGFGYDSLHNKYLRYKIVREFTTQRK